MRRVQIEDMREEEDLTPNSFLELTELYDSESVEAEVSKYRRFVVTTYIPGSKLDLPFLSSLKSYCYHNDAKLLILLSYVNKKDAVSQIPTQLKEETFVLHDLLLNDNLLISATKVKATNVNPLTGLSRLGKRQRSVVLASPKMMLKITPNGYKDIPHALMSTGTISQPNYQLNYFNNASATKSKADHQMSALTFFIENEKTFHFRQLQRRVDGSVCDYGMTYAQQKVPKNEQPEALVLGDWHCGSTDPHARKAWDKVIKDLSPKKVILHDFFDGITVNPHQKRAHFTKAKGFGKGFGSLKAEIVECVKDLAVFCKNAPEVFIVKSNHDLFLDRALEDGEFTQDKINGKYLSWLYSQCEDGDDPLEVAIRMEGEKLGVDLSNAVFLKEDESLNVEGVELGCHGHRGPNGSRGSSSNLEESYGPLVFGHTHTISILRDAWGVGTSSLLDLGYNVGPSSWVRSACLLHKYGARQLLNIIHNTLKI